MSCPPSTRSRGHDGLGRRVPSPVPSRSPFLGPLSLAMGVSTVGLSMLSTAVPLYAVALGATPLWVGAIVALPSVLPALLGVSTGRWVDRVGPARWLAIGTAGTASAPLLLALAPGMMVLAVAQLALGTFQLFATVAAQSLVAGLGRDGSMARDYARFTTAISLGRLVGPALVGVAIDLAGFRPAFALAAGFGAVAAAVAWRVRAGVMWTAPDPAPARTTDERGRDRWPPLLRNVGVQVAVASSAGLFVALSVRQAFLPVALEAHGYSATAIGTLISVGAAATVAVRPAMPRISQALGSTARALVVAMTFVAVGVGLLGLATSPAALAFLLVAAGVGTGVGLPSSIVMVAGRVDPDRRGAALGLRLSLNRVAQLVAPVLVGAVVSAAGFAAGFGVAGVVVAASAWLVARRSGAWAGPSSSPPPSPPPPRSARMEARIVASSKEEP